MDEKGFKTIDEQINLLQSRGLTINDFQTAKEFLLHNNYYRVSGYSLTLRTNDVFHKNAEMQNIIDIYNFDHDLRHLILRYIEIIEVKFKSIYAYRFAEIHGPTAYLSDSFFIDSQRHSSIMKKVSDQKTNRLPHEAYLKHFVNDLGKDIPIWAAVDLFTIADISQLYAISEQALRDTVADDFGLKSNSKAKNLQQFMKSMTIIRNLCAHGSRLYNRLFEQRPSLNSHDRALLSRTKSGNIDNEHFFGFVLIMRRLLNASDFSELKQGLIELTLKYPYVKMKYYGFRDDWKVTL